MPAPKEEVDLGQLFMQLKTEFIRKKIDPKTVRAHLLAHVKKQGQPDTAPDTANYGFRFKQLAVFGLLPIVVAIAVGFAIVTFQTELGELVSESPCLIDNNLIVSELTRPVFNCELCRDLTQIEHVTNISREEFLRKYAYTTVPVVITGATADWKALDTFSFQYFKKLYSSKEVGVKEIDESCQFFNWGYPFDSLSDVFNMTDAQANLEPGEDSWYIGW